MSYPPRPPMPPFINSSVPPPHMISSVGNPSTQSISSYRSATTISSQPTVYSRVPESVPQYKGPIITVFVGNISERAPESLIKRILSACGAVVNWKRVSTFGFCEFDGPTAGMRAVRLLTEMEIDGKKLVAKVDAKNKLLLDNYKEEEIKNGFNETENEKAEDASALKIMHSILEEHKSEFAFDDFDSGKRGELYGRNAKTKSNRSDDINISKALQEANLEDEKRNLISSEIGKFRKKAEADDNRKEKDRKRRDDKCMEKDKSDDSEQDWDKDELGSSSIAEVNRLERLSPRKDVSPRKERDPKERRRRSKSRSKERDREREYKERDRELREKEREREREKDREREREKEREREREKDRERERERDRERDEKLNKNVRDIQREKEMEEELRERKKAEKKAREKEEAYQERLANWELREKRKSKEYEKIRSKENIKLEEREKEAKRLKEFVEDYDDERDDVKYYKGRELQRRLAERVREADLDAKDRNKEQEELEELRNKIFSGEYENPTHEYEKAKKEHEKLYKPHILIDINLDTSQKKERERKIQREKQLYDEKKRLVKESSFNDEKKMIISKTESIESVSHDDCASHLGSASHAEDIKQGSESRESANVRMPYGDFISHSPANASVQNTAVSSPPISTTFISLNLGAHQKKKKIESSVFNSDEDNDNGTNIRKRKLVPLDYEDNSSSQQQNTTQGKDHGEHKLQSISGKASHKKLDKSENKEESNRIDDNGTKIQDEKRKHIKSIIDRIPTQKEDLFNYKLDRSEIDNGLMERKIRPWINKKIIEYIGEPEPTLVDFICSKVLAGSSPQSILDDVQMVLDEEAEVFVVKMWRLLIYEVDAKKFGISK